MLSELIRKKIEQKLGQKLIYSRDADLLSASIYKECKCRISASTIRRMWGFTKGTSNVRSISLDVLAQYIKYPSWEKLVEELVDAKTSIKNRIQLVESKKLKKGICFQIMFGPVSRIVIEHEGKGWFKLNQQEKTELQNDDLLFIEKIELQYPLLIKKIKRDDSVEYTSIVIGSVSGVTDIKAKST